MRNDSVRERLDISPSTLVDQVGGLALVLPPLCCSFVRPRSLAIRCAKKWREDLLMLRAVHLRTVHSADAMMIELLNQPAASAYGFQSGRRFYSLTANVGHKLR
jgi:hypothetical protein